MVWLSRQHPETPQLLQTMLQLFGCAQRCAMGLMEPAGESQFDDEDAALVAVAPLQLLPCPAVQP